ncbi:MAG: homocysteine S-methyltransferase family protein [Alphaproteobacteria bacterium]
MARATNSGRRGLLERLAEGAVICAEGYLFELERRGYLQSGAYVPEAVLEHPDVVRQLHREFVRAGSDVVEAFTYYGHREKLRIIGKEDLLEPLNRQALAIANQAADEAEGERPLVAGNICNTNLYTPGDARTDAAIRAMFDEQVGWAEEAGVDLIIAETYSYTAEALIALEVIRETGLPSVVTMALHRERRTREGETAADACRRLEDAGADVVGLNCIRGPRTMLPFVRQVREAVSCHVAALPVPYRTTDMAPTFQSLSDPDCRSIPDDRPFPVALDPFACNRYEIGDFARQSFDMGVHYLGVCCGNAPHHTRQMAEALGRRPPASRYSPDMSKHFAFGTDPSLKAHNVAYGDKL